MIIRPLIGVWLTTVVWASAVGGMWTHEEHLLKHGREITLQVLPIDPRDMFRGEYVVLQYGISRYKEPPYKRMDFAKGQTVYVSLKLDGQDWKIDGIAAGKPARGFFLRGKIAEALKENNQMRYEILYGVESYFVPEGEGKKLEDLRNQRQLNALFHVTPDCQAKIKRLFEK